MDPGLQVVAVHPAPLGAHEPKVAAAGDGHAGHGRGGGGLRPPGFAPQFAALGGGLEGVLPQGEVLQAPGVGGGVALVGGHHVGPVPLPHLQVQTWVGEAFLVLFFPS